MTLFTDKFEPRDSNDVLEACLSEINLTTVVVKAGEWDTKRIKINIDKKSYYAYVVITGNPIQLECTSRVVYKNQN